MIEADPYPGNMNPALSDPPGRNGKRYEVEETYSKP
jgi:hypothetical protein